MCALSQAQTVPNPTFSNSSACGSPLPSYCTASFTGITTDPANTGAITVITDPAPFNFNDSDIHSLAYAGANFSAYFHYMDWWGCSGHLSIGKIGSNAANIAAEAASMKRLGAAGIIIDWAGNLDSGKACRLANTNAWASYLTANGGFKMGIMVDESSLTATCPTGATDRTTCLTTALNSELDYVNTNYAGRSWYLKDGTNPLVFYFIDESDWTGTNWTTVWANVKGHTNLYSAPFKYIFENNFSHTQTNGAFRWWPTFPTYSATSQLFWGSSSSTTPTSFNTFYSNALSNPMPFGIAGKGFDDGIGFGGGFTGKNRVGSQRCGQTWLDTFNLIGTDGFSSSKQLYALQLVTWNDYEEGTEIETGIDNCVQVGAVQSGQNLNWTLTKTDPTYSTFNTISKLRVVACLATCTVAVDNISPASSGSTPLSGVAGGSTVYMQAVGVPGIRNNASAGVVFSAVPTSPAVNLFAEFSQLK